MTGPAVVERAVVTSDELDVEEHRRAVGAADVGAVVVFVGQVRDHDPEVAGAVVRLEYEAHPDASAVLADLAARCAGGRPVRVAVSHRTGRLDVTDVAVVVAVASAHRAEAFDVCRDLIETVKTDLPIWKRQVDDRGVGTWSGLGAAQSRPAQPPANGGSTSASSA